MPGSELEPTATRVWYDKLIKEGLNFGPQFQSITEFHVPRQRSRKHCTAKVPLIQSTDNEDYHIHPITIDAMLQTAIIATTSGNTSDLRAKVPTRISSATFDLSHVPIKTSWMINANASVIGFGASEINAELFDSDGKVKAQIENVRLAPYEAAAQLDDGSAQRHPVLRVLWKPDVTGGLLRAPDFTKYLDAFLAEAHSEFNDEGIIKLGASLNLLSHKNPALRILELGNDIPEITQGALSLLLAHTSFKRLLSYTAGSIGEDGNLIGAVVDINNGKQEKEGPIALDRAYDLVLLPHFGTAATYLESHLKTIEGLLAPHGQVLAVTPSVNQSAFEKSSLVPVESRLSNGGASIVMCYNSEDDQVDKFVRKTPIVIVDHQQNVLSETLSRLIPKVIGKKVRRVPFSEVSKNSVPSGTIVLSLVESEDPLLAVTNGEQMDRVKIMTDNASIILWVTAGDLLGGKSPNFALVQGLSRALMMEQPSLRFLTFDVDNIQRRTDRTAENIVSVLKRSAGGLLD